LVKARNGHRDFDVIEPDLRRRKIAAAKEVFPAIPSFAKIVGCLLPSRHHLVFGNPTPQSLAGVADAAERGSLAPEIGRVVPLEDAIPVIVELERTGSPKGKLVIVPA
jgi:NADPH:quinone reductase-like Zn-dependent oxidoreductase